MEEGATLTVVLFVVTLVVYHEIMLVVTLADC